MALPNLWGLYNLRSSPFFQATLRADSQATPLRLFVGRKRERPLLLTTIGSSASSRQAVAGRPGIGKTTLVQTVKADAQDGGYWSSDEIISISAAGASEHLLGQLLYEKRFGPYFVEPVVAGLDAKTGEPFICAMDLIGAPVFTKDFVVAGTSSENLYGMCEGLYRPDLSPDELFEVASQALLASVDRDALAGWGAVVHVITAAGVTTRELKARQD